MTPLTPKGDVDVDAIRRVTDHLVGGGARGIFVLGSCGEGPSLTRAQRRITTEAFVSAVAGRVPVLAGLAETSVPRGREALDDVTAAGADAVVLIAPYYFIGGGEEYVTAHLRLLAEASELPVVLYNIPQLTQNSITPSVVEAIADVSTVRAIKDSSADWDQFSALAAIAKKHGLAMFQGAEALTARSILHGADGAVAGIANVAPSLVAMVISAAQAGDSAEAMRLQAHLDDVCRLYSAGFWLSALKVAMSELGICDRHTVAGTPVLGPDQVARVRAVTTELLQEARPNVV